MNNSYLSSAQVALGITVEGRTVVFPTDEELNLQAVQIHMAMIMLRGKIGMGFFKFGTVEETMGLNAAKGMATTYILNLKDKIAGIEDEIESTQALIDNQND